MSEATINPLKQLEFIKYGTNSEAEDLERYLGIQLSNKPRLFEMTLRNSAAMWLNLFKHPKLHEELLLNYFFISFDGSYLSSYGALVIRTNKRPFVPYHENLHAYVESLSEDDHGIRDPETTLTNHCLEEGICTWGAVTVATLSNQGFREAARRHNIYLTGNPGKPNSLLEAPDVYIQQRYTQLEKCLRREVLLREQNSLKNAMVCAYQYVRSKDAVYTVGYFFTSETMKELGRRGYTYVDALNLLITTPPTKLTQLMAPIEYTLSVINRVA